MLAYRDCSIPRSYGIGHEVVLDTLVCEYWRLILLQKVMWGVG